MINTFNVQDFVEGFDNIIPYEVEVVVGGEKENFVKIDETKISPNNYKGKLYPTGSKTLEGNKVTKYKLAQELSLPLQISIKADPLYRVFFDKKGTGELQQQNPITHTNKKSTNHTIRLIDPSNRQVGCIMIYLNESGDIKRKTCYYESVTGKQEIMHTVIPVSSLEESNLLCENEHTRYTEFDLYTETTVDIYVANGVVTSTSVKCQAITNVNTDLHDHNISYYLSRSIFDSKEQLLNGFTGMSWESYVMNEDLLFTKDFAGDYIGYTLMKTHDSLTLYVLTVLDDKTLYTKIDLTGTSPLKGTDLDGMVYGVLRDEEYLNRIRQANKTPLFITRKKDDETEELIGYGGVTLNEYVSYKGVKLDDYLRKLEDSLLGASDDEYIRKMKSDPVVKLSHFSLAVDNSVIRENLEEAAAAEFQEFQSIYLKPFENVSKIKTAGFVNRSM